MKTFQEIEYVRPDFETFKKGIEEHISNIKNAKNYEELRKVVLEYEEESNKVFFMYDVAYIRNCVDTRDKFYEEEMNYFYEQLGNLSVVDQEATKALLASPYLDEYKKEFGENLVKKMEQRIALTNPEIIEDSIEESKLCQEYHRVIAACTVEYDGQECNFPTLLKYMGSVNREERREAFDLWAKMYEDVSGKLDEIYDKLVEVRSRMAKKLGFDSYISNAYASMGRLDYKPEDVKEFREAIKKYIVPLCERLFAEQAKRIGVEELNWYDEKLTDLDGNANPIGGKDEMLDRAKEMYHELSPETGEFFDFMVEHELYDLESKLGKQPGGYCAFLAQEKAPFIFANFNGTSSDVDVLTHEAGHAFEAYTASRIFPLSGMTWATSEINEIHSMAMEYFTYPWMDKFFGDNADKYRVRHIEQSLEAVPYMICVDEIQHRQFEENLDAEGRRRAWKELEETYMPWRKYGGNKFLENGGFWMQKLHIFVNPFYYVDYALAQMGAFEFYKKMTEDKDAAWADYYKLCKSGGSRGYFATLEHAGLGNPFKEETIKGVAEFLESVLF